MDVFIHNRAFRQLSLANFFSMVGDKLFYLAMMTYVSTLPNAQLAIGLITASELIPQMFSSYTGYLADSTRKRARFLILSDLFRSGIYLLVGSLFVLDSTGWFIIGAIALLNLISDFYGTYASGLRQPLIVRVTGESEFVQASGFTQSMSQILSIMAQFAGASLLFIVTYAQLAVVNALTFFLSGTIMFIFFKRHKVLSINEHFSSEQSQRSFRKVIITSIHTLKDETSLLGVISAVVFLNGMLSSLVPILQMLIVADKRLIVGSYGFTLVLLNVTVSASLALGGLLGTKYLKNVSLKQLIVFCLVSICLLLPVILTHKIFAILLLLVPIYFLVGTMIPKLTGWIVSVAEKEKLATTIGMVNTLLIGLAPLATFVVVAISSLFSPEWAIYLLLISSLFLLIVHVIKKSRVK
ncbi:MAG: hypothetical protein H9W82_19305 [Lactobacillus sp.]|nr:hypothetical protein [Lactobacillus sp.]